MIDYRTAKQIIKSQVFETTPTMVPLYDSVHRILAEDVVSDVNMPAFDKAAVDGYACRRCDLADGLIIDGVVKAGEDKQHRIEPGHCLKIMTGARLPMGADCIFMVEDSRVNDDRIVFFTGERTSDNIARFAEDVRKGDIVLKKSTHILPKHIGLLAAMGKASVKVFEHLRAGVITTGDEIVEPDKLPEGTCIRNSNGPQLMAQLSATGVSASYYGIVGDDFNETKKRINTSVTENDVTLITGGVSMGDYDFVKQALAELGAEILIEKIAIKPGKPTVFARIGEKYVFGMPGNPVSTFVIFEVFVKPFLLACMGSVETERVFQLVWATDVHVKTSDRSAFIPVILTPEAEVIPVAYHGSAHIFAVSEASGVACVEMGRGNMMKGERVDVRLF